MSTYTPIASVTLSSAQSSVTFSGIPQTYTDLVVVSNGSNSTLAEIRIRLNSDSGSNYSETLILGSGTNAISGRGTNMTYLVHNYVDTTRGMSISQINNYSSSNVNKTVLTRWNAPSSSDPYVAAYVGLWRNTAAITSVTLLASSGNLAAGSTFNLYGIANASITNVAKATGGDSVTTDGTYWYHTFRSSGTFTPTQALTCDYLVVAGGGGGGRSNAGGGGGGAGGLRCTVTATGGGGSLESALSLTSSTAYTITVGAGGAIPVTDSQVASNGGNSSISGTGITTVTSTGGGGGAGGAVNGATGGSGGGTGYHNAQQTGGAGTANQGYAGGNNRPVAPNYESAGGGGAGQVGANAASGVNGKGGDGVATSISGTSVTYAGGGGSGAIGGTVGAGGAGGGGNGANNAQASAGTANTGGGGGGGQPSGAGGSGIVIVRYAV